MSEGGFSRSDGSQMCRLFWAVISLGLLLPLTSCADDVSAKPESSANPTAGRTGPLPDGGAASCVESYSRTAVAGRAFAFDGVVVDIGRSVSDGGDGANLGLPGVTFEVREWFSGGRSERVTVDMQSPQIDAAASSEAGDAYGIGSRLLVSGEARWGGAPLDAPIGWSCGFSRYYDQPTADAWRNALDG